MSSSSTNSADRIKGIDIGEIALRFAKDKIIVSSREPGAGEHFTVHFGPFTKKVDIHRTARPKVGPPAHKTLFEITHESLEHLMAELAPPILKSLTDLARPLTPEYIEKHSLVPIVGPVPTRENLAHALDRKNGCLKVNHRKLASTYRIPPNIDQLYLLNEGELFFLIVARKRTVRRIGFGFPITDARGRRQLIWVPDRELERRLEGLTALLLTAAAKYGVTYVPDSRELRPEKQAKPSDGT